MKVKHLQNGEKKIENLLLLLLKVYNKYKDKIYKLLQKKKETECSSCM